jgi:hypothetical protein
MLIHLTIHLLLEGMATVWLHIFATIPSAGESIAYPSIYRILPRLALVLHASNTPFSYDGRNMSALIASFLIHISTI